MQFLFFLSIRWMCVCVIQCEARSFFLLCVYTSVWDCLSVSVCVYVHLCVYMCMCPHMCICVLIERPVVGVRCFQLFIFGGRVSHWTGSQSVHLGWLARSSFRDCPGPCFLRHTPVYLPFYEGAGEPKSGPRVTQAFNWESPLQTINSFVEILMIL